MKALLQTLQTLDPDTWRQIQGFRIQHERRTGEELTECDERLQDVVQGMVQRAVVAKGWAWKTEYLPGVKKYIAVVIRENECYTDDRYQSSGDTPCAAILRCYVECLEGQT